MVKFKWMYLLFFIILLSCREDIVEYNDGSYSGKIIIKSLPSGADIYLNGNRTGKITPDSLVSLQPAQYLVRLRLIGYQDTTINVSILAGTKKNIVINFN